MNELAPYVCDPSSYDRAAHWAHALSVIGELSRLNGFSLPRVSAERGQGLRAAGIRGRVYGLCVYGPGHIRVAYDLCRNPVRGAPVRSWSFPGWKSDVTVGGVLAHEFGHWVDYQLRAPSGSAEWRAILRGEEPLTSYEPNPSEAWAEAFRLFTTNPDLLRAGRPARYEFIAARAGIRPAFFAPWREVLARAHPRYLEVAERWIAAR